MIAQNNPLFQRLKAKTESLQTTSKDQVIKTVYADPFGRHGVVRGVSTLGEIVVPGRETLQRFPRTGAYPFHFRKTFTRASGPISRGETPEIEFVKTTRVRQRMPDRVPEPLGFEEWIYRSEAICGESLFTSSPFKDCECGEALTRDPDLQELARHARNVISVCGLLTELHKLGWLHEDMTTHNAMVYLKGNQFQPVLIDLAGSVPLSDVPPGERDAKIRADFSELFRELVLTQFFIGALNNPYARQSIRGIDELFRPEDVLKLARLKSSLNEIS